MAYRYTDTATRLVFSPTRGTVGQEGKIVQFWADEDGTDPVDIGLWSADAPETPGASTGTNQLDVQADSMWPAMWDRDGVLDHMWIQAGTVANPGDLYLVYCDADQRLDAHDVRLTALEPGGSGEAATASALATEAASRAAGDTAAIATAATDATTKVAAEATTRAAADTTLSGLITTEATSRASADTAAIATAAADATTKANAAQAAAIQRANHTGTQSADTLTDGTTNKAFLATERTKLSGIATGATANSTDATLLARANHTGVQAISTVTGLQTALDAKVGIVDYWINVKSYSGIAYDGTTDDSVAFQALLDSIPAAAGNEIGGVGLYFPHGVMLLNTPSAGVLASIANKPNVKFMGTGAGSRIRTSSATATELVRVDTCTNFTMQDLMIQVIGTAHITRALHYTTASPGSSHYSRFTNVTISCNGSYRNAYDVSCTNGSPTIYSALAQFAAGDVGGFVTIDLSNGPFTSTVSSVATLTGTLAANMNTSTTTLTLNSVIAGAPASGFTIKVGNERMFVSAGGNTTTLTVTRGRGPEVLTESHTTGDTVTTYSATLVDNATQTISNSTAPIRIQSAGGAVMEDGFCIGVDHPGASNLDIANTNISGMTVIRAAVSGVRVGNGTAGNNLDHWAHGLTVNESAYGVFLNFGALDIRSGDFDNNLIDIRRFGVCSSELIIDGIRSESSSAFYNFTGSGTSGPSTVLSAIEIVTCNSEGGVPLQHLNSGSLTINGMDITMSPTVAGSLLLVVAGTAASPCHLIANNIQHSGGSGDIFSSVGTGIFSARTCHKEINNCSRRAPTGASAVNTVVGNYTGNHQVFAGGFCRTRTTVADAAYTITRNDMTVVYTSLTAARVVNLPAQGTTLPAGCEFMIKDESGSCDGTKTLTITPPSGTIDGAATLVLNSAYAKATVYTNGTNWFTR